VGREPDEDIGASDRASLRDPEVVLSDVDTVGTTRGHQIGAVVEDEESAAGVGGLAEGPGGLDQLRVAELLVAKLHDRGAAADRRVEERPRVAPARARLAYEVEAGCRQALGSLLPRR
jgi:hypothetical protein